MELPQKALPSSLWFSVGLHHPLGGCLGSLWFVTVTGRPTTHGTAPKEGWSHALHASSALTGIDRLTSVLRSRSLFTSKHKVHLAGGLFEKCNCFGPGEGRDEHRFACRWAVSEGPIRKAAWFVVGMSSSVWLPLSVPSCSCAQAFTLKYISSYYKRLSFYFLLL